MENLIPHVLTFLEVLVIPVIVFNVYQFTELRVLKTRMEDLENFDEKFGSKLDDMISRMVRIETILEHRQKGE